MLLMLKKMRDMDSELKKLKMKTESQKEVDKNSDDDSDKRGKVNLVNAECQTEEISMPQVPLANTQEISQQQESSLQTLSLPIKVQNDDVMK